MKKILITILFYTLSLGTYAQVDSVNVDSFIIIRSADFKTGSSSLFLDNRHTDTLNLGYIIQKKYEGNFIFNIQPAYPLREQFTNLLDSFNSAVHSNRKLLLQLGRLKFGGPKNKSMNQRWFMFRAYLFEVTEKGYCRLGTIDTVAIINVKNNKHFVLNCFRFAGDVISGFIGSCLSKPISASPEYVTLNQIEKIDSIQKSHLPVYTTDTLTEGVYASYESFRNQTPDHVEFDVKMEDSVPVDVEKLNPDINNRYRFDKVYAFVVNNKIYINNNFKYYLLEKRDNDFFFKTTMKTDKGVPTVLGLLTFTTLTILDKVVNEATKRHEIEYEMKLDHLDGSFIPYNMAKN